MASMAAAPMVTRWAALGLRGLGRRAGLGRLSTRRPLHTLPLQSVGRGTAATVRTTASQWRCVSTSVWVMAPGQDTGGTSSSREARRAARLAKRGGGAGSSDDTTTAGAAASSHTASAPSGAGGNQEEKPKKKVGAIAKVKQLWDQYGYVALGLYASLWVVPVGGFYVALAATDNFGVDPVVLLEWANIEWRPTSLKPWHTVQPPRWPSSRRTCWSLYG